MPTLPGRCRTRASFLIEAEPHACTNVQLYRDMKLDQPIAQLCAKSSYASYIDHTLGIITLSHNLIAWLSTTVVAY